MKYTNKNNITTVQRSIAYVLLLSELLTSCGFKESILPSIQPQAPSTSTWAVPQDTSLVASANNFELSTTTIEGTKLTFAYTPEVGLQATYQDATMPEAIAVQQYPVIQDVTGVKKSFIQLTKAEAALLASEGKWEINANGALRYLGMRGRGGMMAGGYPSAAAAVPPTAAIIDLRMPYKLMTPSSKEVEKIQASYLGFLAAKGYCIAEVKKIRSRSMAQAYNGRKALLDARKDQAAFNPRWCSPLLADYSKYDIIYKRLLSHIETSQAFECRDARDPSCSPAMDTAARGVKEVWMWHGTKKSLVDSILQTSFANLATTDAGFFGKGLYFTPQPAYAFDVYCDPTAPDGRKDLFLNKICFYSAYPVYRKSDKAKLEGKPNHENYDAHFIPIDATWDPAEDNPITYDELVVFEAAQVLPVYWLTLKKLGIPTSLSFVDEVKRREQKAIDNAQAAEDKLLATLRIASITREKLNNPDRALSVDESIEVLKNCLVMGRKHAQSARGKDLLVFIGNTGSGKSTTVNYLAGCEMEYIDMEDLGLEGEGEIVRVSDSSAKQALMPIGYTNVSKTFVPTLYADSTTVGGKDYSFTYCDCPGFFDNRGPEINIANAANIHATLSAAKSVKLVLLLNYYGIKADRSRGLKETYNILVELLGGNEEQLEQEAIAELTRELNPRIVHALTPETIAARVQSKREAKVRAGLASTLIAITQVPTEGFSAPKSLSKLRNNFKDFPLLKEHPIVTFDVWDETIPGGSTRASVLESIATLPKIENTASTFRTVLQSSDESRLREIGQELNRRVTASMQSNAWSQVKDVLITFDRLQAIDHSYTQRIYQEIHSNLQQRLGIFSTQIKNLCINGNYEAADEELAKLLAMSQAFERIESCKRYIDMYEETASYVQSSHTNYGKLQATLKQLAANKDELGKLKFLLAQQQEKIIFISTALEQTQQSIDTLATTYTKDQATLQSTYERDINRLKREGAGLHVQAREKARKTIYESDKVSLAEQHQAALTQYQQVHKQQEESLSKQRKEAQGLLSQQKALEEAATRGSVDQKLLELKRLLGRNYVGEEAWLKLGVQSDQASIPAVTEALISRVKAMQTKGGQPLLVLDLGKSIAEMEGLCTAKGINVLAADGDAEKLRAEACYQARGTGSRWLILPGSDHGVLPGSRRKNYADQVKYMESNYPGYAVGGARELVTLAMLKHIQDGTVLFPREPATFGRCKEQYQTGGWKDHQICIGYVQASSSSGFGGLVVVTSHDWHTFRPRVGVFAVLGSWLL